MAAIPSGLASQEVLAPSCFKGAGGGPQDTEGTLPTLQAEPGTDRAELGWNDWPGKGESGPTTSRGEGTGRRGAACLATPSSVPQFPYKEMGQQKTQLRSC